MDQVPREPVAKSGAADPLSFVPWTKRLEAWAAAIPLRAYLLLLMFAIGVLLLLSGDFGRSWDVTAQEFSGAMAHAFYFKGFDVARYHARLPPALAVYGPFSDILIKLVQDLAHDPLQKFKIRVFLQALLSLSSLLPVFLISSRVVSRPLALVAVALVAATPVLFGHAFINPKDSLFASGFVWAVYLILVLFDGTRRPHYGALVGLGVLLGVVASIRYLGAYLLLLVPLAAIVLPALRPDEAAASSERMPLAGRLRIQTVLHYRGLLVLLLSFALAYTAAMPAILANFSPQSYLDIIRTFAHYPWSRTILYFGKDVSAQDLPWHYVYGYLLVQLPLFYHLFALTILAFLALPRITLRALRDFYRRDYGGFSVVVFLFAALIFALALILLVRPVLYDATRHVLFIVPLLCMLLYFGFLGCLRAMGSFARGALVLVATLCWIEAVLAMRWLHPYEYVYYNPMVNPAGSFELDYWATSFREVAERLNDYAREHTTRDEKIRLAVLGPKEALVPFLDRNKFEIVGADAAPQFTIALNRWGWIQTLSGPWLFSVKRGNLVFAAVAQN